MQNLDEFRGSEPHIFLRSPQGDFVALLLNFDAQGVALKSNAGAHGAIDLDRVIGRCTQGFLRNSHRFVGRREVEISARRSQDRLLRLRIETVASCFCKLMGFERFENCVADVGLRENSPARRVTLFVDFFDYALGVLDQVIMATIRDAGRNPRKKSLNRALLLRMRLGQFFARKLDVDVSRAGQPQGCRQIDRQRFRTSIWFGRSSEPDECAKDRDGETPALHLLSIA